MTKKKFYVEQLEANLYGIMYDENGESFCNETFPTRREAEAALRLYNKRDDSERYYAGNIAY